METIIATNRRTPVFDLISHSVVGAGAGALISKVFVPFNLKQSAQIVAAMNLGIGAFQKVISARIGIEEKAFHQVLMTGATLAICFFALTSPSAAPLLARIHLMPTQSVLFNLFVTSFISETALQTAKSLLLSSRKSNLAFLSTTKKAIQKEAPLKQTPQPSVKPILPQGLTLNKTQVKPVIGDIMDQPVEAIVNAANESLLGGGGIDGAIHEEAGGELKKACEKVPLLKGSSSDRICIGEAVVTPSFKITLRQPTIKHVVHTVGPRAGTADRKTLLANAYKNSLAAAYSKGIRSIAFPAISVGIFGYPFDEAQAIAFETVKAYVEKHPDAFDTVLFVYLKSDIDKPKEAMIHSAWRDKFAL